MFRDRSIQLRDMQNASRVQLGCMFGGCTLGTHRLSWPVRVHILQARVALCNNDTNQETINYANNVNNDRQKTELISSTWRSNNYFKPNGTKLEHQTTNSQYLRIV